jgi:hypothetical protein
LTPSACAGAERPSAPTMAAHANSFFIVLLRSQYFGFRLNARLQPDV